MLNQPNPELLLQTRNALARTLSPKTVAIIGVSENSPWAGSAKRTLEADCEVVFVHPKFDTLFGKPCFPDISAIGRPLDVVFSAVSAERTIGLLEQASAARCGGLITIAGGFAETGAEGARLQEEMREVAVAGGMAVVGPNGVGVVNVGRRLGLTMLPPFQGRHGGVSVVAHSGAILGAMVAGAKRAGGVGFNLMISAGNEAVTDMADYLDYLVDDPDTRIIALGIEKIRRPQAFFAAARRARDAGKPIFAIKLGRSARGMRMAASHTGTLTGDAWVYEVAMQQANIQFAQDVDELLDRVQFLEQLPRERWSAIKGLSVLTITGGFATMASDIAADENIDVPEVERLAEWIGTVVPGATVPNPLDATGFVGTRPDIWQTVLETYRDTPEFDSFIFLSQFAEWDEGAATRLVEPFAAMADLTDKPYFVSPLAGVAGAWLDRYRTAGLGVGNGLRGSLRAAQSMGRYVRSNPASFVDSPDLVTKIARPSAVLIDVPEGKMLPFADTMQLLADAGLPMAPFHLFAADQADFAVPFAGPYVVKLADVAHRTEHGAVKINVAATDLDNAVGELRAIAAKDGLLPLIAVQPMVKSAGEAFIGIQGSTELGPLVVFGLGGIFVEVLKKVGGRMAPFSQDTALSLIDEFTECGLIDGFRGQLQWDRAQLANILTAAGQLAAAGRDWIDSIDINPMLWTAEGYCAVDGLCLVKG